MSVSEPDVIDVMGLDRETGHVVLTVSDHLDWDADFLGEHLAALELKLGRYFQFVSSGQVKEAYPQADGRGVRVEVVFKFSPVESARIWLDAARSESLRRGCSLSWNVVPEE